MLLRISILILIFLFNCSNINAEDNNVKVYLKSGKNYIFQIDKIMDYCLITSKNETILFMVIDSIQTKNVILADSIKEYVSDINPISRGSYFSVNINPKKTKKHKINLSIHPLSYNSINFLYTQNSLHRYSHFLLASLWFSDNSIYKIGGALGEHSEYIFNTVWNFNFGLGYKTKINFIEIHGILNYLVSLNPKNPREERGSRGIGSFGAELLIQSNISKLFLINLSSTYYFRKDFLLKGRGFINSLGIGINLK
jgi:hypothetical protein